VRQAARADEFALNTVDLDMSTQLAGVRRDQQIAQVLLQTQDRVRQAHESQAQDIQSVENTNARIRELNDRVLPVAKILTGQDFGNDRDGWLGWWTDQLGYAYHAQKTQTKPTFTQEVVFSASPPVSSACFAVGTSVHTIEGLRSIESIQVGDRVLSQNTTTGALSFQPVLATHSNQPTATMKLRVGGDNLIATGIHRFWKVGQGWTMARDLKSGDMIRSIGATARVESVESDKVQPVYNLDVAENRNFFVGKQGCLVYDYSPVQPVLAPFDREPDLGALGTKGK
jgi:hypothetical protein